MHHVASNSDVYLANHSVNAEKILWRFADHVKTVSNIAVSPSPRTMTQSFYDSQPNDFLESLNFAQQYLIGNIRNMQTVHGKFILVSYIKLDMLVF